METELKANAPLARYNSAFFEVWRWQYKMLSPQEREAIDENPLGPEGDRLEASVISALAELRTDWAI